jgi:hypothetical protein
MSNSIEDPVARIFADYKSNKVGLGKTMLRVEALITEARIKEWQKACQDNWQCPIPEQYALDRIKSLKKKQEKR